MRTAMMMLAVALVVTGCQDEPAPPAKSEPAAAATAKPDAKRAKVEIPKVADDAPKAPTGGKKSWELKIDGKADLSGPAVMMTKPSKVSMYSLIGGSAMTTVNVEDGKTDAYALQVGLTETGEMCMYRADNKQMSKGIEVKLAGDKYQVSGEITCGPVSKTDMPKTVHKISGYFEKK